MREKSFPNRSRNSAGGCSPRIKEKDTRTATRPPTPRPGTRMLDLPPSPADPVRLAEEAMERLRREHPPRVVKTGKRKRKAALR